MDLQQKQQKKDVLYLKRTPTVTYDSTSGAPIPESIKQFYVQQHLPVRKQSLAASHHRKRGVHQPSLKPQFNIPPPIKETPQVTIEDLDVGRSFNEDEDEFNFKGRPPSSIISIQPMDPPEDLEQEVNQYLAHDFNKTWSQFHSTSPPPRHSSFQFSQDTSPSWRKENERDHHNNNDNHHIPADNSFSLDLIDGYANNERLSIDTVLTDFSEFAPTIIPGGNFSESDLGLSKFQEIQQEQLKHINAYRQPAKIQIALLSQVADAFYKKLTVSTTLRKDGIEHHDVFSGKEAVDCLMNILQLSDRSEAVDVGCALRNQNFFHDVNYEPVFVDSPHELYAYKEMNRSKGGDSDTSSENTGLSSLDLPNGIYTDLTDCYSTTCTEKYPCYSWSCPKRKNLKRNQRQSIIQISKEESRLWLQTVPEAIVAATSPMERKRQECIYELIYTEQDFVRDLQYCQDFWIDPLLESDVIPEQTRQQFVKDVFYNIQDIKDVNSELSIALAARQADRYHVSNIGDIMLEHVQKFQPFIEYGSHQVIGKFTFELEKKRNELFAKFVEETERKPQSRRLELNGYLTKPTTRLGRYNLLLREILKRTPDDNPDKLIIPKVMEIITHHLQQVNIEAGKGENLFSLKQVKEGIEFRSPAEYVDLKLDKPGRQLLMKGKMKRKGNTTSEASDLQVFLFDHYILFTKIKYEDHIEKYRVYKRPIPLELLSITTKSNSRQKRTSSILPYSKSAISLIGNSNSVGPSNSETQTVKPHSLSINFFHHGRKGSPGFTLYTSAASIQQIWVKKILDQKAVIAQRPAIFSILPLVRNYFTTANKVNHTVVLDELTTQEDRHILLGTDHGVYITEFDPISLSNRATKIIPLDKVSQVEVMSDNQLLVLADKTLWAYPLEIFSPDMSLQTKRGKLVYPNASFIHLGECMGKKLVCVVKSNTLSGTTIRVLERVMMDDNKKSKSVFSLRRLVKGGPTGLKAFKDLYSPSEVTSIGLLKTQMCITSPKEIGVVDMKSFGVQALLDPEDEALDFVFQRPDIRPVTVYRIEFAKFLVCYNEFAFCVDQRGRFIRSSVRMDWEGGPDSFALSYPYVLAFEPDFIEVRNIENGELVQVIRGKNIRCTSSNIHNATIQCAMDDPDIEGYQFVFQLEKNHY